MGTFNATGYSADVDLWLSYDGHRVELSQVGPTFVIAKSPIDLVPGDAIVVVSIDGEEMAHPVHLVDGMRIGDVRTRVLARDVAAAV